MTPNKSHCSTVPTGKPKLLDRVRQAVRVRHMALSTEKTYVDWKGSYTPEVVECNGFVALVYREPSGWRYLLIADDEGLRTGRLYSSSGGGDYEETKRSAINHVVHLGMDCDSVLTADDVPEIVTDKPERAALASYAKFQRRFKAARARGLDSNDAHSYAGRDPSRAELWVHEENNR